MNKSDDYSRRDKLCKMCNYTELKIREIISTYCVSCSTGVVEELIEVFDTTLGTHEGRENKIE